MNHAYCTCTISACVVDWVWFVLNTSMSSRNYSIVDYCAEHAGYRCGYCKSTDTNYSHGKRQIKILGRRQVTCQFG